MILATEIIIAVLAGLALGLFHFGGLYLTLRRLPKARRPAVLMIASALLRMAVVLAGFVLIVLHGQWYDALAALAGFTGARMFLIRKLGPRRSQAPSVTLESDVS